MEINKKYTVPRPLSINITRGEDTEGAKITEPGVEEVEEAEEEQLEVNEGNQGEIKKRRRSTIKVVKSSLKRRGSIKKQRRVSKNTDLHKVIFSGGEFMPKFSILYSKIKV